MTLAEAVNNAKKCFILTTTCDGSSYKFQVTKTEVRRNFADISRYHIPDSSKAPDDAYDQWIENVGAGISCHIRKNFGEHTLTIHLG